MATLSDEEKLMLEDKNYPSPEQDDFQLAIYEKREFNINKAPKREKAETYNDIKKLRDSTCNREVKYSDQQVLLSNFINPHTPYRGILIYHGTGVGKTGAAIAIAEKFKPLVERYHTRIHVLVPGPLNKQNFMKEIIKFTGETYMKFQYDKSLYINDDERDKMEKGAMALISQYYRIIPFRSFYNKVLGEKTIEKYETGDKKIKKKYLKNEDGEFIRELSMDRIHSLNNTLLIIDEAHGITGNETGDAVRKIIANSTNLKIVLMSATPMKNRADDIIELLNFIRPLNYQMERDQIYTGKTVHQVEFKPNGKNILRKMCRGYVSFLRGADPLTFAERVDMGVIPKGLSFTKVTQCFMLPFQLGAYNIIINAKGDSLDRKSESVANFVFPGFPKGKISNDNELVGYSGPSAINEMKNQLHSNSELLCKKIANTILSEYKISDPSSLMYLNEDKNISGMIFNEKYLKHFSIKFYTALQNINNIVYGKKGSGLIFIYSNLVKVGVELFREILMQNGYLEYDELYSNYNISGNTKCYYCGYPHGSHSQNNAPQHTFHPATFVMVTGRSEENLEKIPEEQLDIIYNVFNKPENKDGKNIKIILGSKVMNEGITLYQIKETHILDVHYNLQKVDQAIGRSIRWCVHYNMMTEDNPFPKVEIFKYVISLKSGEISSEEELYKKAENKYVVVKETERILQEEAIDCPLNRNNNIFLEELAKYKDCGSADKPCPAICGYMSCDYKCGDQLLNAKYYDPENNIYRKVEKDKLDYSTYNMSLAKEEINYAKEKIKEMYKLDYVYKIEDILAYVKKTFSKDKQDQFDNFYVYQALNDLIPITANEHNNFTDTVTDKLNRPGYLIYRDVYYIFNPFDKSEDVPMYYRVNPDQIKPDIIYVNKYLENHTDFKKYNTNYNKHNIEKEKKKIIIENKYDFDSQIEYYDNRDEYDYVGIIDQPSLKSATFEEQIDEFKIREKRPKVIIRKRETGISSFRGSVCSTSKDKKYLIKVAKHLNIKIDNVNIRTSVCNLIRDRLFALEKYSTTKQKNKMTYLIIPSNHPSIPFPLNLEDRVKHILNKIQNKTQLSASKNKIIINNIKDKNKIKYPDIQYVTYEIQFGKEFNNFSEILKEFGAKNHNDIWTIIVE